jgi:hypothetical protein
MMSCLIYLSIVAICMFIALGLWFRTINHLPPETSGSGNLPERKVAC